MNILWRWNANDDKGLYSLQIRPSVYGASSLGIVIFLCNFALSKSKKSGSRNQNAGAFFVYLVQ